MNQIFQGSATPLSDFKIWAACQTSDDFVFTFCMKTDRLLNTHVDDWSTRCVNCCHHIALKGENTQTYTCMYRSKTMFVFGVHFCQGVDFIIDDNSFLSNVFLQGL